MEPNDSAVDERVSIAVEVLYFARLREVFGRDRERAQLPADVRNVADFMAWLRKRGAPWDKELAPGRPFLVAINEEMADPGMPIRSGDTVAIMPPVTGG
ncbi:MAG TPA: molybdopterin converting factor subunit 1 [Burkholderiales bacterium]|nr:molybdopterin converting factor subunit 1 [Burkholderiales bacterium]